MVGTLAGFACLACIALPVSAENAEAQGRSRLSRSIEIHGDSLPAQGGLVWNTFLGTQGGDKGLGIAVDSDGNIYVTGMSAASWGSPLMPFVSYCDAFVAKLDSNGSLLWNTFLGGADWVVGAAVAVDSNGNVYVTGESGATWGSPVRPFDAGGSDGFVAKLDRNGSLLWNTFLGAPNVDDDGLSVAVDNVGNVYVGGSSQRYWGSPISPWTFGNYNAFVAKLDANGSLLWNTFLGVGQDADNRVAIDGSQHVFVAGTGDRTWGSPLRPYTGGEDTYVAKLNSDGSLLWNTFLGGDDHDFGEGIAVGGSGDVYVGGWSSGTWGGSQTRRPYTALNDGYVAKLDTNGALQWNTFLGGGGGDVSGSVAVDGSGNIYLTGSSSATWGSPIRPYAANDDIFAAKLNSDGWLLWNTFLGGGDYDEDGCVAIDDSGNVYVTFSSYATWGSPIRPYTSEFDAVVAKLQGSGPSITSMTSKTSKPGSSATINSTGFSTDKKKNIVYFGTKKVKSINKAKTTSLKVTIPKVKKGIVGVYVEVNGQTSNTFQFQVK